MDPALVVACFLVLVVVTALSPRIGVSAPLALVATGAAMSFLPWVERVDIPPELVLAGVLPPLLFATAVNLPVVDLRREMGSVTVLSVAVVLVSALACGLLVSSLVPGVSLAAGIALGAVLSPTDAVATTIVKQAGVNPRVVTVLDGEAMLNDATALVLLRTALAATAGSISLLDATGQFLKAVVLAVVVGAAIAALTLALRSRIQDQTINVALSFVVPFLAYLPAEELGASGLVATVVTGLIIGYARAARLPAAVRRAESITWRSLAYLLESGVFLFMGLQTKALVEDFGADSGTFGQVAGAAGACLLVLLVVRTAFVAGLVRWASAAHVRSTALRHDFRRLATLRVDAMRRRDTERSRRRLDRVHQAIDRREADLVFYAEERLRRRDGTIIVWAGMRGSVTLAAAQTIPTSVPHRPLLVLTAFAVAVLSLLAQGGTLGWAVRRFDAAVDRSTVEEEHQQALTTLLDDVADATCSDVATHGLDGRHLDQTVLERARDQSHPDRLTRWAGEGPDRRALLADYRRLRRTVIDDQRTALLDARATGRYNSAAVREMLRRLDSGELTIAELPD